VGAGEEEGGADAVVGVYWGRHGCVFVYLCGLVVVMDRDGMGCDVM